MNRVYTCGYCERRHSSFEARERCEDSCHDKHEQAKRERRCIQCGDPTSGISAHCHSCILDD